MKILVCIKQVVDIEQQINIRPDGQWIAEDDDTRYHINYFDEFAIEEAVRIKEAFKNATIDAITVGPAEAESTLRRALALGVDNAVHILCPSNAFLPAEETSRYLAEFMIPRAYDLVLFGVMSEDAMQGLTGPMTAARCGLPCAAAVVEQKIDPAEKTITVVCELSGGVHETVRLPLPAVLTAQSGINRPRYASLSNRLRAKSQAIETLSAESIADPQPRQHLLSLFVPPKTGTGQFIQGTVEEKARTLLTILHEKSLI